ncbi:hypothetical protein GLOIN_2v1770833 [Rhizophagus irregularis DAOM 181602=DAOM 197198]|nr:hypothetical protein GLOIN_2v1770833 [Rhizophagus irregularis DAOM 181602=DAOM 197198]
MTEIQSNKTRLKIGSSFIRRRYKENLETMVLAIDVEESLNKAHDRFLCLYNDLFTVNLSITTRYNIATSMDLSVYYFEEFKRKSSKKNSLF